MSQLPIAYLDIRFCVHATEDIDKVMKAIHNIVPINEIEEIAFNKSVLEGHYGNPITFFEARIKDKQIIKVLVENISANLSPLNKDELSRETNRYFEKGSLYIRLDKQAAFQGKIRLVTSDPVRVRIRFKESKIEDVIEIGKEIGMLR